MRLLLFVAIVATVSFIQSALAQDDSTPPPARGSLIEDRAAHKLVEAGDARLEADEPTKAVEVW